MSRRHGGRSRGLRATVFATALATLLGAAAAEAVVDVRVAPSPSGTAPTVGDPITITVLARDAALVDPPRFPTLERWGDAEVVSAGDPVRDGDAWRRDYVVRLFRPGEHTLPALEVSLPGAGLTRVARSAPVQLTLASVLPQGEPPQRQPPAPPVMLPWTRDAWLLAGALALLLAIGVAALVRQRRRRGALAAAQDALAALPPVDELAARLAALAGERSSERLHTGLSLALRRFLGRELDVPAPESTTTEIHRQLVARELPAGLARTLVRLLRDCDAVKFARHEATSEVGEERLRVARDAGRELDAHLHPPVAVDAADANPPLRRSA